MSLQRSIRRNRAAWHAGLLLLVSCFTLAGIAQDTKGKSNLKGINSLLIKEVRHEIIMLSDYSVFDNITFSINKPNGVVLMGQVVKPNLKQDAENVVRNIKGIGKVANNIEIMPLSPQDNTIRRAAFRAIYSQDELERYTTSAVPSIHIIVKNGNIILEGVAANQMDKDLAGNAAKQVSGVINVTNNLSLESSSSTNH
jgi:hyperosmotically inducible periplasmic protein